MNRIHPYARFDEKEIDEFEKNNLKYNMRADDKCVGCCGFGVVVDLNYGAGRPLLKVCGCYKPILRVRS